MGMFDSVYVECPRCEETAVAQSKGGKCLLRVYTLSNCPDDVLSDVNRHSPYTCRECGCEFRMDGKTRRTIELKKEGCDDCGTRVTKLFKVNGKYFCFDCVGGQL